MHECKLNPDLFVRNIAHEDPDVTVFVVEDFLKEPNALVEYAREKAISGGWEMIEPRIREFATRCQGPMPAPWRAPFRWCTARRSLKCIAACSR